MLKSIKTKLALFLTLFLLVVFAGNGFVTYLMAAGALDKNMEEIFPQLAVESARLVASRVEIELNGLEILANNYIIRDKAIDWQGKKNILEEEVKRRGHVKMGIADKEGNYQTTAGETLNIKDREHFIKAINGQKYVSDPLVSKADGSLIITYAVPIRQNNEIIGVLVAVDDSTSLTNVINDIVFMKPEVPL